MLACHDLRTPLATVHGFAHTLGGSAELDDASARYVEMISTASGQLAELLDLELLLHPNGETRHRESDDPAIRQHERLLSGPRAVLRCDRPSG